MTAADDLRAAELTERYDLIIFDADDTLRRSTVPGRPCPHAPDEWEYLPGCQELLSQLLTAPEVRVALASNQDHVGYGLLSEAAARDLLLALLAEAGGPPDPAAVELCPHRPDAGCGCRKPAPGLLLRLMARFSAEPGRTLFVGDAPSDREAARRAGIAFRWTSELFLAEVPDVQQA